MREKRRIFTREFIMELVMEFFVVTACVCMLEGIIGLVFRPEQKFGYEAFWSPPIFGVLSLLCGIVLQSGKELEGWQMVVRKIIHLLLIELVVFGLNYSQGASFGPVMTLCMIVGIAVVYIAVSLVMYFDDRRLANQFNAELKRFQSENDSAETL